MPLLVGIAVRGRGSRRLGRRRRRSRRLGRRRLGRRRQSNRGRRRLGRRPSRRRRHGRWHSRRRWRGRGFDLRARRRRRFTGLGRRHVTGLGGRWRPADRTGQHRRRRTARLLTRSRAGLRLVAALVRTRLAGLVPDEGHRCDGQGREDHDGAIVLLGPFFALATPRRQRAFDLDRATVVPIVIVLQLIVRLDRSSLARPVLVLPATPLPGSSASIDRLVLEVVVLGFVTRLRRRGALVVADLRPTPAVRLRSGAFSLLATLLCHRSSDTSTRSPALTMASSPRVGEGARVGGRTVA